MSRVFVRLATFAILTFAVAASAKEPFREKGVLAEMQSVSCGVAERSGSTVAGVLITGAKHTKSRELLCQEYVLKTDRVTYRIRPKEEKHPVLLRVGDEAQFRLKKDEMLLRVPEADNKEREYIVVSMSPSAEFATSIGKTQHPPKPHAAQAPLDDTKPETQAAPSQPSSTAQPSSAASAPSAAPAPAPAALAPAVEQVNPAPSPASAYATAASLQVDSTPQGAQIFIDSAQAGRTPALLHVTPGTHSIQVVMGGYKDWVDSISVAPGGQQRISANLSR